MIPASLAGPPLRNAFPPRAQAAKILLSTSMSTVTAEPPIASQLSQLDQLKKLTRVVADTGDFESMRAYQPQDATTNPSLILQAVSKAEYAHILDRVIADRKNAGLSGVARVHDVIDPA